MHSGVEVAAHKGSKKRYKDILGSLSVSLATLPKSHENRQLELPGYGVSLCNLIIWELLVSEHPTINFLMETKKKVIKLQDLHFMNGLNGFFATDCIGHGNSPADGLAILWGSQLNVDFGSSSLHHIDLMIHQCRRKFPITIEELLDRAFINMAWSQRWNFSMVSDLPHHLLDHCSILMESSSWPRGDKR
ncbi:hypothetical protein RIF29_21329 [Crotalaria pallida]|uniref:Uncharacterized protein n=1 Tax=Crotalaria pallida TaxID=3830 RepID=A0AAN9I742_CROPI